MAGLAAALLILNASVTFDSLWPTPAIRWTGALSIELAILVLAWAAWRTRRAAPPSPRVLRLLAAGWLLLVLGRYGDVTAQALYGRDINLYWDLRFMPDVASMLARAAPLWLVGIACAGAIVLLTLLYLLVRWALGRVAAAMERRGERRIIAMAAAVAAAWFAVEQSRGLEAHERQFPAPVSASYVRQARLVVASLRGGPSVAPSPPMSSDLSHLREADVLLVFLESYGAVVYDRPEMAAALEAPRRELASAIAGSGHRVVSAFVESPTFGGVSWLAHITLMSGVEVRDPHTNAVLMTQQRDTLVDTFSRRGYRTVALMPGLWQDWPEGAFYGFDQIYGARRLDYRGPQFGWFTLTDQFALAKIAALEIDAAARPPLFVFFPTISTHTPFTPTPPYQPDWGRLFDERPYDKAELDRSYEAVADWMNLGPGYVQAVTYAYRTLAGYLQRDHARDFVLVLIGDHQPPAAVSGERAPWDVPVHVVAREASVLDPLRARGFRDGLVPGRPVLGPMHTLLPILLEAFGTPE
jgi:hypothetical protein